MFSWKKLLFIGSILGCAAAVLLLVYSLWGPRDMLASSGLNSTANDEENYKNYSQDNDSFLEENKTLESKISSLQEEINRLKKDNEKLEEDIKYMYSALGDVAIIRHGDRESNKVAITIDDGWDPFQVVKALLILEEKNVKATLFPVGSKVEKYPLIWRRAVEQGHELGNHTYTHNKIPEITLQEAVWDISKWERTVNEALNKEYNANFFRPPGMKGFENAHDTTRYQSLVALSGLNAVVLWDVDHSYPLPSNANHRQIANYVIENTRGGSIILLHFIEEDVKALPLIIDGLQEKGYQLVTLNQLL